LSAALAATVLCSTAAACGACRGAAESGSSARVATSAAISELDLRERVDLVADDSMQGRFTGSAGHVMVTEYLAGELARMGAKPAGERGTYFQDVPFVRRHLVAHDLSANGDQFELGRDFVPLHPGGRPRGFDGTRVVFGGVLEDTTRQIDREEARGKFVILVYGDPRNRAGNIRSARPAERLGTAAAIATVNPDVAMDGWRTSLGDPTPEYAGDDDPDEPRVGGLAISADAAERLLGQPADTTVAVGTTGALVHGEFTFRAESLTVRNVIAVLPGRDAGRSAEYVALGAHSDHVPYRSNPADFDSLRAFNTLALEKQRELGRPYLRAAERAAITVNVDSLRAISPVRYDSIYNGADDDASGTAALLEIAEALAADEERPSRSILFVWHAAEELGLLGSRYFTDQPTVDRDAIVAQLNIDMIGRGGTNDLPGGGPGYLQLIGWRRLSTELGDVIDGVNRRQAMPFVWDLQYDAPGHREQLYCRSDHYNYARHGIPVAFFSTGLHVDYHQVTDEPQYLDYAKLARVTRLVRDVAVSLADLDRRPTVNGPVSDPDADCVQ
jgi:hypothetical protein